MLENLLSSIDFNIKSVENLLNKEEIFTNKVNALNQQQKDFQVTQTKMMQKDYFLCIQ